MSSYIPLDKHGMENQFLYKRPLFSLLAVAQVSIQQYLSHVGVNIRLHVNNPNHDVICRIAKYRKKFSEKDFK